MGHIGNAVGGRSALADDDPKQIDIDFGQNNFRYRNGPSGPPKIESDFTDAPVIPNCRSRGPVS